VVLLARGSVRRGMPRSGTTEQLTLDLLDLMSDSHPGRTGDVPAGFIHRAQMPIEGRMKLTVADSLVGIDYILCGSWRIVALGPPHVFRNDNHG
jgi:hypothetical protein